jgi:hypothetical protein
VIRRRGRVVKAWLAVPFVLAAVLVSPASAAEDEVTRCRITVMAPQGVVGTATIFAAAHVTCRYVPSLAPAWQKSIKLFVALQRWGSPRDFAPDIDAGGMNSVVSEGDYMAHARVYHTCDYTTVNYYWRARAWAVNYSMRGQRGKSPTVGSKFVVGRCD